MNEFGNTWDLFKHFISSNATAAKDAVVETATVVKDETMGAASDAASYVADALIPEDDSDEVVVIVDGETFWSGSKLAALKAVGKN